MRAKTTPPTPIAVARPGDSGAAGLRGALVEQVDEAIEGLEEEFLGALAGVGDLDRGEAGDPLVGAQVAQQRVGGGAHAVAPAGLLGDRLLGAGEELVVDLAEDGGEAGVEIGVMAVEGRPRRPRRARADA